MWSPVSLRSIQGLNPQSVLWIAKCRVWKQGVFRSYPTTEHLKVRASNQDSVTQIYRFFIATWPASGHASTVRLWCSSLCQQLISSSQWGSECLVVILANHLLYPCVKQNGPGNWFSSQWISEHLHFNCFLAMSGWPRKTPVNCHSPPLEWKGVEGGFLHRLQSWFVSFSIWKRRVTRKSEQSKLGASRDSGEPLPRWRGIPLWTWSKLKQKTLVSICFLHLLAKAPNTLDWSGNPCGAQIAPNMLASSYASTIFNRSWIFGQDLQLVHTCISFVHENPFHPLARQCRGASDVRRKRGTVPLAGACSGMPWKIGVTHKGQTNFWAWSGFGTNVATIRKDLQTWIMRMISLPSSRVWTMSFWKKSLVLVASHAKCRSKLVMILHVIAVGWPILCVSNGLQNGCLLWTNPQHSNTFCAENQWPPSGCWMPFMAHMVLTLKAVEAET